MSKRSNKNSKNDIKNNDTAENRIKTINIDHTFREVRKLAHDMDRYLSVIYLLLEQGKVEDAMEELENQYYLKYRYRENTANSISSKFPGNEPTANYKQYRSQKNIMTSDTLL